MQPVTNIQAFATREPPVFESKQAEQLHVRQRLAATCRIFGRRGLSDGLLGHVTARDPAEGDRFWVNPIGVPMHSVKASQLLQVDHQGRVVRGEGAVNPVGLLLHTALHRARPDVAAVCHAHAPAASTWASLERPLDPITQDACVFFERQALIRAPRLVRDAEAATRFAEALGDKRVAIHTGHGVFTTGSSVDEAAWWFVLMDRCCDDQLRAEAAGTPTQYSVEDARWLASTLGSSKFGWLSFQTLWDDIVKSDPDLLD
jgi:ribulose-5-phosphate 4-epimerase/fuculose-1-phosphate aldolase